MSVAGRIVVREIHGIRRFLYPLALTMEVPDGFDAAPLGLQDPDGSPVPSQVTPGRGGMSRSARLDFAVSLGPMEERVLLLCPGIPSGKVEDPLHIEKLERHHCRQRRFETEIDSSASLHQVVYDGIPHLAAPAAVTRNGERAEPAAEAAFTEGLLAARFSAGGQYPDGCPALSRLDLTACKSWVSISHVLSEPRPGDVLAFHLPFAIVSPRVTCDFGVGGGLYGKLDAEGTPEIVWSTEFEPEHPVRWSLITAGRTDYEGEESGPDAYRSKCWFHLIDRNKSLAVAVTGIPADCAVVTASLRADGNCVIAFRLGSPITGPAQFGACYHFLYDIPPVSAATNPQSILLPPQVEAQLRF